MPRLQGCLLSLHAWLQPAANVSGCKPGRRRFCRCGVIVFLFQQNCLVVKSMLLPSANMINVLHLNSSLPFCFFSLSFSLSPSLPPSPPPSPPLSLFLVVSVRFMRGQNCFCFQFASRKHTRARTHAIYIYIYMA